MGRIAGVPAINYIARSGKKDAFSGIDCGMTERGTAVTDKNGICVESYVQRQDGTLVSFDELEGEERRRAAALLRCKWLGELFRGEAEFAPEEE